MIYWLCFFGHSHELDLEESAQMSPQEALLKLGFKCKPDPQWVWHLPHILHPLHFQWTWVYFNLSNIQKVKGKIVCVCVSRFSGVLSFKDGACKKHKKRTQRGLNKHTRFPDTGSDDTQSHGCFVLSKVHLGGSLTQFLQNNTVQAPCQLQFTTRD